MLTPTPASLKQLLAAFPSAAPAAEFSTLAGPLLSEAACEKLVAHLDGLATLRCAADVDGDLKRTLSVADLENLIGEKEVRVTVSLSALLWADRAWCVRLCATGHHDNHTPCCASP
eukprot:SAG11_NODE_8630_length_993_cov_1.728188_2_plen_116_part_00